MEGLRQVAEQYEYHNIIDDTAIPCMDLLFYRDVMNVRCFLEHTPNSERVPERMKYRVCSSVCVCKERTVESVGMFDLARSRGSSEPSLTHTTLDFPERTWEQ